MDREKTFRTKFGKPPFLSIFLEVNVCIKCILFHEDKNVKGFFFFLHWRMIER